MGTKFYCMLLLLAACWTTHGAVIDLNGVDLTVTELNEDGYVNTSQTAATLTADLSDSLAYAGTISGNLSFVKEGPGTLTLSSVCPYTGTTHVDGGVIEAPTDAYFGSGNGGAAVTLSNEARVRLTTTCTLLKRLFGVAEGAMGHMEMPAGVVVTTPVSNLFFKGAVLTKTGDGTLALNDEGGIKFNQNNSAAVAGGTLRVADGSVALTSSDVFGNASGPADMTLELCSGRTLDLNGLRNPLPRRSLLRGATITTKQRTPENKRFEQFAYMKDYDLNSVFTVYPGEGNAVTSVISAVDGCHLAQQPGGDTIFDVQEGAVLRIEARLYNAHTKTGTLQGFVKRGTGALVLAQPCSANGTLTVEAGTIVFTRSAYLASAMTLAVWPGATVVLDDGTILASPLEIPSGDGVVTFAVPDGAAAVYANPGTSAAFEGSRTIVKAGDGALAWTGGNSGLTALIASGGTLALRASNILSRAAIWVDPSDAMTVTTDASDGTPRVIGLRNKGRTGGAFIRNAAAVEGMCVGPAYLAAGINGLAALSFDGNAALATRAFTNRSDTARSLFVFCVFSRDRAYEATAPYGPWNGPFSFSSATNTGEDSGYATGFCVYEHNDAYSNVRFLIRGCGSGDVNMNTANLAQNEPYLFAALQRAGGGYFGLECAADDSTALPANRFMHGGSFACPPLSVDIVQLGGRLGSSGRALWTAEGHWANRMWFGRMGEFIAFDKDLTQEDQDVLLSYLRKKWLGKGNGSTTPPACLTGVTPSAPALTTASLLVKGGATLEHAASTQTLGALTLEDGATLAMKAGSASPLFTVSGATKLSGALTLDVSPEPTETMRLFTYETLLDSSAWTITGGNAGILSVGSRPGTNAYWLKVASGTMIMVH